ncbi:trypsin-like serine protease, partial [Streptomyces sp. NPDC004647]|uniref:trypsin-like serine protease n=1 Tax=Streptomyces sp. NPDC004647 TaxID=3154671 RepID=UPI00339F6E3F
MLLALATLLGLTVATAPGAHAIVGGTAAAKLRGQVQVQHFGKTICTGTLIDVKWVLTAKHCFKRVTDDKDTNVLIGDRRLGEGERRDTQSVSRTVAEDAALIELSEPSTRNELVVDYTADFAPEMSSVAVRGWGRPDPSLPDLSPELKVATMRVTGDVVHEFERLDEMGSGVASHGDSGGGIQYGGKVVGVVAQGDEETYVDMTPTYLIAGWIERVSGIKPAPTPPTPLRVMPLGDSITAGVASSTGSGYRAELWDQLNLGGRTMDFVGTQRDGTFADIDHEGHPGKRIDEIADLAYCPVRRYRPNVVTLHAGTNDMDKEFELATAPGRLG